jgi:hypothetical protein
MTAREPALPIVCPHCRKTTEVAIAKLVKDEGVLCRSCGKTTKATAEFLAPAASDEVSAERLICPRIIAFAVGRSIVIDSEALIPQMASQCPGRSLPIDRGPIGTKLGRYPVTSAVTASRCD